MNLALLFNTMRPLAGPCRFLGQLVVACLFFQNIAAGSPAAPAQKIASHGVLGSGSQNIFVQRYTASDLAPREELSLPVGSSFVREVSSFAQTLGSDAATHEAFQKFHAEVHSRDQRTEDIAHFYGPDFESTSASSTAIGDKLRDGTSRQVSSRIVRESVYLQALRGGMRFNMNLSSWGKASDISTRAPQPVRYGLVLRGIEPSFEGARSAAIGEFRPEDLAYAGQAKPVWGIGPVEEEARLTLYHSVEDSSTQSAWGKLLSALPRPDFSGKIEPKSTFSLNGGSLPPMLVTMDQNEGLYHLEYHTGENFKKETLLHGLSLPLYERVRVGQTLTESWEQQKTSLENVLNQISGPRLNVHYLTTSQRYQSDLLYYLNGAQVIFTTDAPRDWNPGQSSEERYELKLLRNF